MGVRRQSWPFFCTPLRVYLGVIGPIAVLMAVLAVLPAVPGWMRLSSFAVLAISLYAFYRGYGRRVVATDTEVRYVSAGRSVRLPWSQVRHVGRYTPLDRNLATQYVYITRRETPPVDWREIDADTIQLQDRPGLVDALHGYWEAGSPR